MLSARAKALEISTLLGPGIISYCFAPGGVVVITLWSDPP